MAETSRVTVVLEAQTQQFQRNLSQATARFETFQRKLEGLRPTGLTTALDRVQQNLRRFRQNLRSFTGAAFKRAISAIVGSLRNLQNQFALAAEASRAFARGFGIVAGAFAFLGGASIKLAASLEQAKIAFTTLLGSATEADAFLRRLADFAAQTPFEFTGLQQSSRLLLAFGFEAQNIIPIMGRVGDSIAALGGGEAEINRLVRALGQIQAKGKLSAEELLQIAELGIPAYEILREKLNLTEEQLGSIGNAGISSATAINALLEGLGDRFAGSMQAQSQTLKGLFSTAKDEAVLSLTLIGTKLIEVFNIKEIITAAIGQLRSFRDFLENGGIEQALERYRQAIILVAVAITGALIPAFVATIRTVGLAAKRLLPWVLAAEAVYLAFKTNFLGITDIMTAFLPKVRNFTITIVSYFLAIRETAGEFVGLFSVALISLQSILEGFGLILFGLLVEPTLNMVKGISSAIELGLQAFATFVNKAGVIFEPMKKFLKSLGIDLQTGLLSVSSSVATGVSNTFNSGVDAIKANIVKSIQESEAAAQGLAKIKFGQGFFNTARVGLLGADGVNGNFQNAVIRARRSLEETIPTVEVVQDKFVQVGESISGLGDNLAGMVGDLTNFDGAFVEVGDGAVGALGKISKAAKITSDDILKMKTELIQARDALRDGIVNQDFLSQAALVGTATPVDTNRVSIPIPDFSVDQNKINEAIRTIDNAKIRLIDAYSSFGRLLASTRQGIIDQEALAQGIVIGVPAISGEPIPVPDFSVVVAAFKDIPQPEFVVDVTPARKIVGEFYDELTGETSLIIEPTVDVKPARPIVGEVLDILTGNVVPIITPTVEIKGAETLIPLPDFEVAVAPLRKIVGDVFDVTTGLTSAVIEPIAEVSTELKTIPLPEFSTNLGIAARLLLEFGTVASKVKGGLGSLVFGNQRGGIIPDPVLPETETPESVRQSQVDSLLIVKDTDNALQTFGKSLLNVAVDTLPLFESVLEGFASGGIQGAISAFFVELVTLSDEFNNFIEGFVETIKPFAEILGRSLAGLFKAVDPLIKPVFQLATALTPLVDIIAKVLLPVFKVVGAVLQVVANIISGIVEAFVGIYNFLLGWLFGRIDTTPAVSTVEATPALFAESQPIVGRASASPSYGTTSLILAGQDMRTAAAEMTLAAQEIRAAAGDFGANSDSNVSNDNFSGATI